MSALLGLMLLAADPEVLVTASRQPFAETPVPPPELAVMRGGLLLPNGLNVAIGIDLQTRIDGYLVLHTIYASEGELPGIRVFTNGEESQPTSPATLTVTSPAVPGAPVVIVDRSPTGTTILPTASKAETTVNVVAGDPSTWLDASGQTPVPVQPDGPPVAIPGGAVTLTRGESGAIVTFEAPDIKVQQLVGQATGVVIANMANNRTIETVSSVNVDVRGLSPALLSGIFAAQRAVLDALSQ